MSMIPGTVDRKCSFLNYSCSFAVRSPKKSIYLDIQPSTYILSSFVV